jgi:hypothetical protein
MVTPEVLADLRQRGWSQAYIDKVLADNGVTLGTGGDAEAVVCMKQRHAADDVRSTCMVCKQRVFHRPHAPNAPKICLDCYAHMEDEES